MTRKRGIFHYRRRLPGQASGEVTLSLATRSYREAEHRAGLLDEAFGGAWERVVSSEAEQERLGEVLREFLRRLLDNDVRHRLKRAPNRPVYAWYWDPEEDPGTADEADIALFRSERASMVEMLTKGFPDFGVEEGARDLATEFQLPAGWLPRLVFGMREAYIQSYDVKERRSRGTEPVVFQNKPPASAKAVYESDTAVPEKSTRSAKPAASALVEPFFVRREKIDHATHQVMGQERATLRLFLEARGDLPVDTYGRGDITVFLDTLRQLPTNYGKSPKDKGRSIADLISEADAAGAPRLADKTVKRHLSALSQFFQTAVDAGHLSVSARNELVEDHRFRVAQGAREQRDMWTTQDLTTLFNSPVWQGCHPHFRSQPGPEIIRDAKFWLPILALHHGARLEEFADLYRRDIGMEGGRWFMKIVRTEGRRLKTDNSVRTLPLHPELVRLGFPGYVQKTAPNPDDPLFPDIEPQGRDRKRGPRITRWFVEYRRAVGVYREGVGMHAFRHTAITRLRNAIQDVQQDRHVDFLMGHAGGGGEGRQRYDKGPGLKVAGDTLGLLRFPEIDLSHLYEGPS